MLAGEDRDRDQRQQDIKRCTCMKKSHLSKPFVESLWHTEVATWPAPDKLENIDIRKFITIEKIIFTISKATALCVIDKYAGPSDTGPVTYKKG